MKEWLQKHWPWVAGGVAALVAVWLLLRSNVLSGLFSGSTNAPAETVPTVLPTSSDTIPTSVETVSTPTPAPVLPSSTLKALTQMQAQLGTLSTAMQNLGPEIAAQIHSIAPPTSTVTPFVPMLTPQGSTVIRPMTTAKPTTNTSHVTVKPATITIPGLPGKYVDDAYNRMVRAMALAKQNVTKMKSTSRPAPMSSVHKPTGSYSVPPVTTSPPHWQYLLRHGML